jgi:RNA recognition motif-containing protein
MLTIEEAFGRRSAERSRRQPKEKCQMNLYVGNLSYRTTDQELREIFEAYGEVDSARTINDRETGQSRGFGFVEMANAEDAQAAIAALHESE